MKPGEINCPKCGEMATANTVDNGVGKEQCGPYGCEHCGWVEPTLSAEDILNSPLEECIDCE